MELNTQCKEVRASYLHTYIAGRKENILFILDDLWKEYDVEKDFGIPCRSESRIEGCKILMISRSQHTLQNQLNTEKLFEVNSLSNLESWKFFMTIVGEFVEDECIQKIAKDVVKECGGLPIALKILAKALKGKRLEIWKDALKKLKNPVVVNIPRVSDQLYSCIQFSYDSIEDEAKLVLLLCSVFPDDYRIEVKDLQVYAMGMGLLNHINTWEDAKNRVIKLVDDLKSSYLLLAHNEGDRYVQMHDVVHDFSKYVASKNHKMSSLTYGSEQREWEEGDRLGSYHAIYVDCTTLLELPPKLEFPNLQLFIFNRGRRTTGIQISDNFFERMEELRVLDMRTMCYAPSLTHSLKNLQTLCLYRCKCIDIETIGGQLKKLKIFTISECKMMEELPVCMSEWTQLKVLQVLDCSNLKVIHPNVISKMTKLEELSLWMSFIDWGKEVSYKNKLIKNVELSELNCLTHLVHLELKVRNVEILSNELSLDIARKLEEFHVYVGGGWKLMYDNFATTLDVYQTAPNDSIGGAFPILLQKCEGLVVTDFVGFANLFCNPQYGNCGYPRLKYLKIDFGRSRDMTLGIGNFNLQVSFQLMNLWIIGANGLEILWPNKRLTTNSFFKLQRIYIHDCNKFTYMLPWCMVRLLVFLKSLTIKECKLLERIFEIEESTTNDVNDVNLVVPLTQLELGFLPKLKHLWNYDQTHELLTFPNLEEVQVLKCPQLKTLFPAPFINLMKKIRDLVFDGEDEIFGEGNEALHLMSPEIVLFPSLRYLKIHCKLVNKRSSWVRPESFSVLKTLHLIGSEDDGMVSLPLETSELVWRSLTSLQITNAFELVQVFQNGEENNKNNHQSSSRGAKLEYLSLDNLPSLTHVWKDNNNYQMSSSSFDSLKNFRIRGCEILKCLLPSSISFFNLEHLTINKCNGMMILFDSSVVRNLVNLQYMDISYCIEMKYIIVAPKGEDEKREDIIFYRLLSLSLGCLPRLESFQLGKCMLRFPSLEKLYIYGCLEMKTFNSYGTISTPKLSCVEIEHGKVSLSSTNELNAIIEDVWKNEIVRSIKNLFTQHQDEEKAEDT